MFYLTTHSKHFIYGYMASDIWLSILVEYNHLARTSNDIFSRCGVEESFQFHPELDL